MNKDTVLWEILLPTVRNNGKPFRTRHHRVWDREVIGIAGGLTIFPKTTKGVWVSREGSVFTEQMIPVRVACTASEMDRIADFSAKHYDQYAIMFYKVSDQVYIRHYEQTPKGRKSRAKSTEDASWEVPALYSHPA